jgi:hypothetical protein
VCQDMQLNTHHSVPNLRMLGAMTPFQHVHSQCTQGKIYLLFVIFGGGGGLDFNWYRYFSTCWKSRNLSSIPGGPIYFSLLQTVQNGSGAQSASYLVGTCDSSVGGRGLKVSSSETSHKHPHLLPRLKVRGAVLPLAHVHSSMHRDSLYQLAL